MVNSEKGFAVLACVGVLASLAIGMYLRFGYLIDERLLPAKPPPPPPPDQAALQRTDYTPQMYEAYLAKDAQDLGVPAVTATDLSDPFPYELSEEQRSMAPGGPAIETRALKLSLRVEKLAASTSLGSYLTEHLILRIENRLQQPLAYRVDTAPEATAQYCLGKADLAHDALALAPGETIDRTECLFRPGMRLRVGRIEALIVPELSYHYVSRLVPLHIGLDGRAARGHRYRGEPCASIPEQAIRLALQKGTARWRDIVDFYARHRCETYLFPPGYRAFSRKAEHVLPVSARALAADHRVFPVDPDAGPR